MGTTGRRRLATATASATVSVALVLALLTSVPASAAAVSNPASPVVAPTAPTLLVSTPLSGPTAVPPSTADDWQASAPSTAAAPASIVPPGDPSPRVVAILDQGDRPVIRSWEFDSRTAAIAKVARLQDRDNILAISTESREQFLPEGPGVAGAGDPSRSSQWALTRLRAEAAWATSRGASVTVAVIDTGVAVHPDLQGSFAAGADFAQGGSGRNDGNGHGTHVAGIIAATADNGVGIAGLAPDVTIMPIKVLSDSGSGYSSDVARGIIWAADHGADIISMSLGGGYDTASEYAVAYAISRGVIVIAAAGNERTIGSPTSYPAAFPGVLAVAATDSADGVAYFSNAGAYVDISAPGVAILSTIPGGYASWSGTSMATPYVSAVAALGLSRARAIGVNANIPAILTSTADDLGPTGQDNDFGFGLVDPLGVLSSVDALASAPPLAAPTDVRVTSVGATMATITWTAPANTTGIQSYRATTTPGGGVCTASTGTMTCTLTGLTAATAYHVAVRSIGSASSSVESVPASFTTTSRVDAGGDTSDRATALMPGITEDFIDTGGDIDWWALKVAGPGDVRITMDNLPDDFDITVYDPLGSLVGWGYNYGAAAEQVNLRVGAGTYLLRISGWNGARSDTQPYRLVVDLHLDRPAPPDGAGDTPASAGILTVGTTSEFLTVGDVDFWAITVASTSDLTLTLGSLPADYDLVLYDATGAVVLGSSNLAGLVDDIIRLQLTSGTYVARVTGYQGAGSDEAPYALTLALTGVLPPPPPDLGGDTPADATDLVPGIPVTDPIDAASDLDFWRLTVPSLSRVSVTLMALPADYTLSLRTADGSTIATSRRAGTADESIGVWLQPGTYVLRINAVNRSFSAQPYYLIAQVQPLGRDVLDQAGNSVRTATALPEGLVVHEIIHAASDRDVWSFVVPRAEVYTVTLSELAADYTLTLMTATGRTRAVSANTGIADEVMMVRLTPGVYLLRVGPQPGQWSTQDYRLDAVPSSLPRSAPEA